jgi:hypothetical protein
MLTLGCRQEDYVVFLGGVQSEVTAVNTGNNTGYIVSMLTNTVQSFSASNTCPMYELQLQVCYVWFYSSPTKEELKLASSCLRVGILT